MQIPDVDTHTHGESFEDAIQMAQDVVGLVLEEETEYPDASKPEDIELEEWETPEDVFICYVTFDLEAYRKALNKTVSRNIVLPEYLDNIAKKQGIDVSKVATEALEQIIFN